MPVPLAAPGPTGSCGAEFLFSPNVGEPPLPLNRVARIAGEIGAEVDLHPGTARRVLRAHVQALQQQAADHTATEARP